MRNYTLRENNTTISYQKLSLELVKIKSV